MLASNTTISNCAATEILHCADNYKSGYTSVHHTARLEIYSGGSREWGAGDVHPERISLFFFVFFF